jgi:hypothetical protein
MGILDSVWGILGSVWNLFHRGLICGKFWILACFKINFDGLD